MIAATQASTTTSIPTLEEEEEENVVTPKPTRQPKLLQQKVTPPPVVIEASEVDLQLDPGSVTSLQGPAPPLNLERSSVHYSQESGKNKAPNPVVATPVTIVEPEVSSHFPKNKNKSLYKLDTEPFPFQIRTQVNVVASSPNLGSGEFIEGGDFPTSSEQEQQEQEEREAQEQEAREQEAREQEQEDQEHQQAPVEEEKQPSTTTTTTTTTTTPKPPSKAKHGFTLKLSPKHNSPVIVTPAYSTPVVVTAQKVELPPTPVAPSVTLQPTGLLDKIYETKVDASGVTTVVETAIIGTYIGSKYVRLLETNILPPEKKVGKTSAVQIISAVQPTKAFQFPSLIKPTALSQKALVTTTTSTTPTPTPAPEKEGDDPEQDENDRE